MELFCIVIIGICIYVLYMIISTSIEEQLKMSKMTPSDKAEYLRKKKEVQDKIKYNGLKYTCPMCGSHKIKTISKTNRSASAALFGAGSDKMGKLYECDDCKYKW